MEGVTVVVVGGSSGVLGAAISAGLAERGAAVVGTSRSGDEARQWPTLALDVTDEGSVASALQQAAAVTGRVDAVVNATGITHQAPVLETNLEDWDRVLRTNLTGAFLVARAGARLLAENEVSDGSRGSIVTLGSLCASAGCDGVSAYAASKAGVVGLTKTLASELAALAIRVNCVSPGVFLTPLNSDRLQGTPRGEAALSRTPLGRFGRPEELVGAVSLLVSRAGSFITGTELIVDGGFLVSGLVTPHRAGAGPRDA